MNERIKELAEQATTYIEPTSNSGEGWIFDKEKFAELIVRECAGVALFKPDGIVASDDAEYVAAKAAGRLTAVRMIKQHFGVEE
jgi:hypothetical protein